MKSDLTWNRKLWGVVMTNRACPREPLLIGKAWHIIKNGDYPGEPTKCLLFVTRKDARAWCVEAEAKHRKHSPDCRFRPMRVRETVRPI